MPPQDNNPPKKETTIERSHEKYERDSDPLIPVFEALIWVLFEVPPLPLDFLRWISKYTSLLAWTMTIFLNYQICSKIRVENSQLPASSRFCKIYAQSHFSIETQLILFKMIDRKICPLPLLFKIAWEDLDLQLGTHMTMLEGMLSRIPTQIDFSEKLISNFINWWQF